MYALKQSTLGCWGGSRAAPAVGAQSAPGERASEGRSGDAAPRKRGFVSALVRGGWALGVGGGGGGGGGVAFLGGARARGGRKRAGGGELGGATLVSK